MTRTPPDPVSLDELPDELLNETTRIMRDRLREILRDRAAVDAALHAVLDAVGGDTIYLNDRVQLERAGRMHRAKILLLEGEGVAAVAVATGYSHAYVRRLRRQLDAEEN